MEAVATLHLLPLAEQAKYVDEIGRMNCEDVEWVHQCNAALTPDVFPLVDSVIIGRLAYFALNCPGPEGCGGSVSVISTLAGTSILEPILEGSPSHHDRVPQFLRIIYKIYSLIIRL